MVEDSGLGSEDTGFCACTVLFIISSPLLTRLFLIPQSNREWTMVLGVLSDLGDTGGDHSEAACHLRVFTCCYRLVHGVSIGLLIESRASVAYFR